jgi:hypothetical protein
VTVAKGEDKIQAEAVLLPFGQPVSDGDTQVAVRLAGGAGQVASVVRALDEAHIHVESLELHMPTLDDVFQIATGRRLEGAEVAEEEPSAARGPAR